MTLEQPEQDIFHFINDRQERIYQHLLLVGDGPAYFYKDACLLMISEQITSTTHLVSHLLREIESALRAVLETYIDRSERLGVKKSNQKHKMIILGILKGLEISETEPVAKAWLSLADSKEYGLASRAHRDALARPRPVNQEFRKLWDQMEEILDFVLEKYRSRYLETHKQIDDMLTREVPTSADSAALRNTIPNNQVTLGYFFERLSSPAWLTPLNEAGYFRYPPEPERNLDEGTVGFPYWPASEYLSRMAGLDPEVVLNIIVEIPRTDNVRVHNDMYNAAISMPAKHAVIIANKELEWIRANDSIFLVNDSLSQLVVQLAVGGHLEMALNYSKELLSIVQTNNADQPKTKLGTWEYERFLNAIIPDLLSVSDLKFVEILCGALESAIKLSGFNQPLDSPEDYSYIWQRKIDNEKSHHRIRNILVSAIKESIDQLIMLNIMPIDEIVTFLDSKQYNIFRRLSLYTVYKHTDKNTKLADRYLTNKIYFDTTAYRTEYNQLAAKFFGQLTSDQQGKILAWIDERLNVDKVITTLASGIGNTPSSEQVQRYIDNWMIQRLSPFHHALPSEWKNRYEMLVEINCYNKEVEEEEDGVWIGPTSPKELVELDTMTIENLIDFLLTWKPVKDWRSPTPEGLGMHLSTLIEEKYEQFAEKANLFKKTGIDPTYIRSVLWGFRKAVDAGKVFKWGLILDLCIWATQQKDVHVRTVSIMDQDYDWEGTRKEVAGLLSSGLNDGDTEIPFNYRGSVWKLLEMLSADQQPTIGYEEEYLKDNNDLGLLSINTVRGEAMHTVVRYALWVHRHTPGIVSENKQGFEKMPEVQKVLEEHLDLKKELTLSIRSIYGKWLPWLVLLDDEWLVKNLALILPADSDKSNIYRVTWETYILYCQSYDNVFEILHKEYKKAVERIKEIKIEKRSITDPEMRLAEHLATLYWRGILDREEYNNLLPLFFENADDELAGHFIEFIGRGLYNSKQEIKADVIIRMKKLWDERSIVINSYSTRAKHEKELSAFSWWFSTRKFNKNWLIENLYNVLESISSLDSLQLRLIIENLECYSIEMPKRTIECLTFIAEMDTNGWGVRSNRKEIRKILENVLNNPNDSGKAAAVALIHKFGSMGNLEFRDLLY